MERYESVRGDILDRNFWNLRSVEMVSILFDMTEISNFFICLVALLSEICEYLEGLLVK